MSDSSSTTSSNSSSSKTEAPIFHVGETFKTFEEVESKLKLYERATSTKFWMRDCRTVDAARKRTTRSLSTLLRIIKYFIGVFMEGENLSLREKEYALLSK